LEAILKAVDGRKDAEVIVVDNNSNDHTTEVAEKYPGVLLLREPRRGANRARETGFEASHGDLVAFLDADTRITPDWIDRMEKEFEKDPKLVCMSGPFIYYDLPRGVNLLVRVFYRITYAMYLLNTFVFRKTSVVQGGTEMVRRTALEAIGGHNVNLSFYGDDTDLATRLRKVGKVRFSYRFAIRSSGRRLAKEGAFTMGVRYSINYFWIVLFSRPFTTSSKEVRPKEENPTYQPENKKKEWVIASVAVIIVFGILGALGYGAYLLIQSGVISTAGFIQFKLKAQQEARAVPAELIQLANPIPGTMPNNQYGK
jgi:cellulose synthase/poly-beta-1,6-N-acetylglucosamine synthase-like glycosyltransferase